MRDLLTRGARLLAGATMAFTLVAGVSACDDDDDPIVPPEADELMIVTGNNQDVIVGAQSEPLVVTVLDQFGDPLPGANVQWSVTSGDGTLNVSTSMTDANGQAQVLFLAGSTAGAATIGATVADLPTVTFTVMVEAAI
jgi:hypothetical protein